MKLLFPNGEHEPIELKQGTTIIGTSTDCEAMLIAPGIAARHCELRTEGEQTLAIPLDAQFATVLNGRQIVGEAPIKPGDLLLFAKIGCRVVASEKAPAPVAMLKPAIGGNEDDGRTRVRMALPKYLLRGVSGPTFGKVYAMVGTLTVGRNSDCGICIPTDEISRHHAKLQVVPAGVMVEDMGSANGTFVNNQRVLAATLLKPGDELRLDTVRFLLMSPGMESHPAVARSEPVAPTPVAKSRAGLWAIVTLVAIAATALAVLGYLGKF
jgi:pSer/pThr/pTyr-binding forkhead associated (FHA) protein